MEFLQMATGSDIIETLSNGMYSSFYTAFDEVISNSYDSDATVVKIKINRSSIHIGDNGRGMDLEGLKDYFTLGYSPKKENRVTTGMERKTIGKFGLGKITTATICDKFRLVSVRNGKRITATVGYKELKKEKFIKDYQIPLEICDTNETEGTLLVLEGVKSKIDKGLLKRRIIRNMPLKSDFKVILNDVELKPEDAIKGDEYNFEFETEKLGKIKGKAILSSKNIKEYAGIYIKVNGRIVNADDPNWLNVATTIGYKGGFATRLYCTVDADILDSCILVNRNGLKKDDPLFMEFQKELRRVLSKLYRSIVRSIDKKSIAQHSKIAKDVIEQQLNKMIDNTEVPEDFMKKLSRRKDADKIKGVVKKIKRKQSDRTEKDEKENEVVTKTKKKKKQKPHKIQGDERNIKIGRRKFKLKIISDMGKEDSECVFDQNEGVIYINVNHPQYTLSLEEDSLYCYFRRAMAYEIAKTLANNNFDELTGRLEDMLHADIKIIE